MTASAKPTSPVGIDDMACHVPGLCLPIKTLAEARNLEYAKLNKGLGLEAMAVPGPGEDAATMAAGAVLELLLRNDIDPRRIGRLYVGTESAVDGAKPTASYVVEMLSACFTEKYGADCWLHCDAVDLTFACIGAVDALQNTIDWVRADDGRIGIVVAADHAKYELGSGGEYTQGAGAVAMLVKARPRLLAIGDAWGVATRGVHDFFKPVRRVDKTRLIEEVLQAIGENRLSAEQILEGLMSDNEAADVMSGPSRYLSLYAEMPVFDGPYSNDCYQARIGEALADFQRRIVERNGIPVIDRWARMVFHLPYAYQARRMCGDIFWQAAKKRGDQAAICRELGRDEPDPGAFHTTQDFEQARAEFIRAVTKTAIYRQFVEDRIEKGERASSLVGNVYTASLFLSLMSALEADLREGAEIDGARIGFFAYGSGSKSKVFEGVVQAGWREVASRFQLMNKLERRRHIDYPTYEALHRGIEVSNIDERDARSFRLTHIQETPLQQRGARAYRWEGVRAPVDG
jgi:hydroxymethylglutaryl-CoA synthase